MSFISQLQWPCRAVVTAGMPYGNKKLHFGHVAGVFVPADAYARFLRDRIGKENVLFVSGTDCFGSPIEEGYRRACEDTHFEGSIIDYVQANHDAQKATLDAFNISLDIYQGSGIGLCAKIHQKVSNDVVSTLFANGHLHIRETMQFFDPVHEVFLNGRQVVGHCPVQGCKSEKAYADECDLGHQFSPEDLIHPTSTLSGETPQLRPVKNWYFDLPSFRGVLEQLTCELEADKEVRPVVSKSIREFLAAPVIYVKVELEPEYRALEDRLPLHNFRPAAKGKQSFELVFDSIEQRDFARDILTAAGIRFRTGKTLVPFRISGNVDWGVTIPEIDGIKGLTLWCWPESLWAPISFTAAALEARGQSCEDVRAWWCDPHAKVYQFIGQDNLYFYGVAQPALFCALQHDNQMRNVPLFGDLQQTHLVANHHILFGKTKASSSGAIKPPSADELLNYYTCEQLRAHWLALGLDQKSVGFKPKPFDPDESLRNDPRVADAALKEGALLTNVLNRLARSCFYEAQKSFEGFMPLGTPSIEHIQAAHKALHDYECVMHKQELHSALTIFEDFVRMSQKVWSSGIARAQEQQDLELRRQVLLDSFYLLRVCTLLAHPIAPMGAQKIAHHLAIDEEKLFSWDYDFESMDELCSAEERLQGKHRIVELAAKSDFFEKHPRQFK